MKAVLAGLPAAADDHRWAYEIKWDGYRTIVHVAYEQRRGLLVAALEPGPNWLVPAHRVGDGAALMAATAAQGLEGVMAKRLGSRYLPGRRSPTWRKVKHRITEQVVIGGYSAGSGSRAGRLGALLVGVRQADGRLRFVDLVDG